MIIPNITIEQLLEAGVHLGHKTLRWNPKMKKYIFGRRDTIHIIDLTQTIELIKQALEKVYETISNKGKIYLNENRSLAIKKLITHGNNIAILDDGLQENIIDYDLSIVCFNQKQWIGNGLIIPSGPLRESFSSIKRFNCIMINGKKHLALVPAVSFIILATKV